MKKLILIILIVVAVLILIWAGFMFRATILTAVYAEEFTDFKALGYDFMHPWEDTPMIRVLSYRSTNAIVYFCSSTGGEKVAFVKTDSGWTYLETLALWSSSGSAEHYFIWPYYKDWVL